MHTPGPWRLSDETERDGLRSKLIYGMPEGMLAIVRVEHQGAYYGDANARLIAAAPDMIAALKLLVEGFDEATHGDHPFASKTRIALEAIAKAEGSP